MAEERLQRRLAAVLSADVVGYSRLMGLDEAGTLSRLNALRRELIDPTIAAHSGRIVKLMGDGALMEFASAVDAVTCAIEIQRQLRAHGAGRTEANPIQFRIGINVGDVIIDGEDILGDGVNVAARIEGVAEPGGISISENVLASRCKARWWQARRCRRTELKEYPPPAGSRLSGRSRNRKSDTVEGRVQLSLPETPSIAVLPFQNMSGDFGAGVFRPMAWSRTSSLDSLESVGCSSSRGIPASLTKASRPTFAKWVESLAYAMCSKEV